MVRRPDKQVFFARQMKTGEALRAPLGRGLVLDVTEPSAFYAYGSGGLLGPLVTAQTGIDKVGADAQAMIQAKAAAQAASPVTAPPQ